MRLGFLHNFFRSNMPRYASVKSAFCGALDALITSNYWGIKFIMNMPRYASVKSAFCARRFGD